MKFKRYPLSYHIAALFITIVVVVGSVLIAISYRHAATIIDSVADEISEQNRQKFETAFNGDIQPLITFIDLLSLNEELVNPSEILDKPYWLSVMQHMFEMHPNIGTFYFMAPQSTLTKVIPIRKTDSRYQNQLARIEVEMTTSTGEITRTLLDAKNQTITEHTALAQSVDESNYLWFRLPREDDLIHITQPRSVANGEDKAINIAMRSRRGNAIIAADFRLQSLQDYLPDLIASQESQTALFDLTGSLLASHNVVLVDEQPEGKTASLNGTPFSQLTFTGRPQNRHFINDFSGNEWSINLTPVSLGSGVNLLLAQAVPYDALIANLISMRNQQMLVAVVLILVSLFIVLYVAKRLTKPLLDLSHLANKVTSFEAKRSVYPRTIISEVDALTRSVKLMEQAIHDLLTLMRKTSTHQHFDALANTIAKQCYAICRAETVMVYTLDRKTGTMQASANQSIIPFRVNMQDMLERTPWLRGQLMQSKVVHLSKTSIEVKGYMDQFFNSDIYLFPMLDNEKRLVGLLNLGYERSVTEDQEHRHAFISELLRFAQVAKSHIDNLNEQKSFSTSLIDNLLNWTKALGSDNVTQSQTICIDVSSRLFQLAAKDQHYFPKFKAKHVDDSLTISASLLTLAANCHPSVDRTFSADELKQSVNRCLAMFGDVDYPHSWSHVPIVYSRLFTDTSDTFANQEYDISSTTMHIYALGVAFAFTQYLELNERNSLDDIYENLTRLVENGVLMPRCVLLAFENDLVHSVLSEHKLSDSLANVPDVAPYVKRIKHYLRSLI